MENSFHLGPGVSSQSPTCTRFLLVQLMLKQQTRVCAAQEARTIGCIMYEIGVALKTSTKVQRLLCTEVLSNHGPLGLTEL